MRRTFGSPPQRQRRGNGRLQHHRDGRCRDYRPGRALRRRHAAMTDDPLRVFALTIVGLSLGYVLGLFAPLILFVYLVYKGVNRGR